MAFLFSIFILLSTGKPAHHAKLLCAEVIGWGDDGEEPTYNLAAPADSAGRVIIYGGAGTYHCEAWADGWRAVTQVLQVTKKNERLYITLTTESEDR